MPLWRTCLEPGCDEVTTGSRCDYHEMARRRRREVSRPSRQARGYDAGHDRARRELARLLPMWCGYGCRTWLTADDRWVAAHVVDGRPELGYLIACGPCNERAKRRSPAEANV